ATAVGQGQTAGVRDHDIALQVDVIVGMTASSGGEVGSGCGIGGCRLIRKRLDIESQAVERNRRKEGAARQLGWHRALNHSESSLSISFVVAEEEDTILADGSAERASKFVKGQPWFVA